MNYTIYLVKAILVQYKSHKSVQKAKAATKEFDTLTVKCKPKKKTGPKSIPWGIFARFARPDTDTTTGD